MKVLVTGGAGYIGSVVTEELLNDGHEAVVFDSLYKGHRSAVDPRAKFVQADLTDSVALREVLKQNQITAVIHMAADSLVGESVEQPAKYYHNNLAAGLSLLDAMLDCGVGKFVFSSTAATYGEPKKQPITETDPTTPTNPYGETKLAFERVLHWYEGAYGVRYANLRYFNAAGATERCGEWHDPETHLIPLVLQVAAGMRSEVTVYGNDYPTPDGTCIRDYIHVVDLARAHVLALKILDARSDTFNLGCGGRGYSVQQVIDTARAVTGRDIRTRVGARRGGDPAVLIASSDKIKQKLGWQPKSQDLRMIVESAWQWMSRNPRGYQG